MDLVAQGVTASASFLPVELAVTVTSDEHSPAGEEVRGSGNSTPDWETIENENGSIDVWLRAERSGSGDGRTYTIVAVATDAAGNTANDMALVKVAYDRGKGKKGKLLVASDQIPQASSLLPNQPNPFNPSTTIAYDLSSPGPVSLVVYNLMGQRIRVLAHGVYSAGRYTVVWDGRDERGLEVASGVYLYRLDRRSGGNRYGIGRGR